MRRTVRLLPPLAACALLLVAPVARGQQPAPPASRPAPPAAPPPADSELEEKVTVRLAEVQILVTDRDGNPLTDLKPGEVEVREDGESRKIAYLEPFSTAGSLAKAIPQPTPVAAPGEKAAPPETPVAIPNPAPQRWVVVLFDVLNSRTMDRKHWVAAARNWVATDMRPEDRVSLAVLESEGTVRELVPFTGDREILAHALAEDTLLDSYPHRDYTNDMRRIVEDLTETCDSSRYPESCISGATEPLVFEWRGRGEQTLRGLTLFSGSLGAIPGRKAVLFLGPGIVPDPRMTAANAGLAVFGADRLSASSSMAERDANLNQLMLEMTRLAATADVSFFTLDSRPSSLRDQSTDVEQSDGMAERKLFDPFQQIFDVTRGSLDTIAIRTGGRSLHGPSVDKNLPILARSVEGIYSLGFYRDPASSRKPSIKVKVARRAGRGRDRQDRGAGGRDPRPGRDPGPGFVALLSGGGGTRRRPDRTLRRGDHAPGEARGLGLPAGRGPARRLAPGGPVPPGVLARGPAGSPPGPLPDPGPALGVRVPASLGPVRRHHVEQRRNSGTGHPKFRTNSRIRASRSPSPDRRTAVLTVEVSLIKRVGSLT